MYQKLGLAALALLVSSVAVAGDQTLYKDLDADQDGQLSQEEAAALPALNDQWTVLDANADGMLDQAEFAKMEVNEMKEVKEMKKETEGAVSE
jgi:hypothetical protein